MATGSDRAASPGEGVAGPLYCDASALAKLFWPEAGSDELNRLVAGRDDVLVSDLGLTEVVSAMALRVREGTIEAKTAARVHRRLLAVAAGPAVRRIELLAATHREAERLLLASERTALRTLDSLHLALALGAGAGTLVTYDQVMANAAMAAGLAVWPEPTA